MSEIDPRKQEAALRIIDAAESRDDSALASVIVDLIVLNNPELALVAPLASRLLSGAIARARSAASDGASAAAKGVRSLLRSLWPF